MHLNIHVHAHTHACTNACRHTRTHQVFLSQVTYHLCCFHAFSPVSSFTSFWTYCVSNLKVDRVFCQFCKVKTLCFQKFHSSPCRCWLNKVCAVLLKSPVLQHYWDLFCFAFLPGLYWLYCSDWVTVIQPISLLFFYHFFCCWASALSFNLTYCIL